jgi:hypothetical protein
MNRFGRGFTGLGCVDIPPDVLRSPVSPNLKQFVPENGNGSRMRQDGVGGREAPPPWSEAAIYIGKTIQSRVISVGTTPVSILKPPRSWPYLIVNANRAIGQASRVTALASTAIAAAYTTQSNYVDVAAFSECHIHLDITALAAGTWDIYAQSYDSVSGTWFDTQRVFAGLTLTTDEGYAMIGPNGLGERLAFRFDPVVAGTITCSIGLVLKAGYGSQLTGFSKVVYLGGPGVSTTNGFPLIPGEYQTLVVGENVEVWGVSESTTEIRIFEL